MTRLTPHQRWALLHLQRTMERHGRPAEGFDPGVLWADVKDTGSQGAMEHLVAKGYAACRMDHGPRGGELRFYTLTRAGVLEALRITRTGLKVGSR